MILSNILCSPNREKQQASLLLPFLVFCLFVLLPSTLLVKSFHARRELWPWDHCSLEPCALQGRKTRMVPQFQTMRRCHWRSQDIAPQAGAGKKCGNGHSWKFREDSYNLIVGSCLRAELQLGGLKGIEKQKNGLSLKKLRC